MIGTTLGPYRITAQLGAGGMGEVYRAEDTRLGREVAVKVLPAEFVDDPERRQRFEREARAIAALSHPNILALYDVGFSEGAPYLVCELLAGETLRQALGSGPLPLARALEVAAQIARGLAAAHDKGIVHRDLKPENVFLTREGQAKILDFGLARQTEPLLGEADGASTATRAGEMLGTVGYMAPEQVRGEPADPRADLFACGCLLHEMLTGQRPFARPTGVETLAAVLHEELPALPATVPAELAHTVERCLVKDRERRFQSARDLAFRLDELAAAAPASGAARAPARRGLWVATALGVALLAAGAWWLARLPGAPAAASRSIAVLPFENLSPERDAEYFADGVTEDIIAQLAKIQKLKVISRTSVMRYKGSDQPLPAIARELGVATILEGSVRRAGNQVRIVSQLIDARTDEHLWAETYDRTLEDLFAIQSEVASRIAEALSIELSSDEAARLDRAPTGNATAYDLYLQGRERYLLLRATENEEALRLFQQALGLDPRFALARADLAKAYFQRAELFGYGDEWYDAAVEEARQALAIDPDLPEGHAALGLAYVGKGEVRRGAEEYRRAVELEPNLALALGNLAYAYLGLGRFDEALEHAGRAASLLPGSSWASQLLAAVHDALGDSASAEAHVRRAIELQADRLGCHKDLLFILVHQGRLEEAVELARRVPSLVPADSLSLNAAATVLLLAGDLGEARRFYEQALPLARALRNVHWQPLAATHLGYVYGQLGLEREAEGALAESLRIDEAYLARGHEDWTVPYDVATVHAARGEAEEALRWLERAVEAGWRGWRLGKRDPLLEPLAPEPRFRALMDDLAARVAAMRERALGGGGTAPAS